MQRFLRAFVAGALLLPVFVWAGTGFHWGILGGTNATLNDLRSQQLTLTPNQTPQPASSPTVPAPPSPAGTPYASQTSTASPSPAQSPTLSFTGTATPSVSPSATPSLSNTTTSSLTATGTPASATPTGTPTGSPTPTGSATPTASVTPTATPTGTFSNSPTPQGTPGCSVAGFYDTDGSEAFSDDVLYFVPLYVANRQTVDGLSLQVATPDGGTLQCALYSNTAGSQPGTLLALSAALPMNGAGSLALPIAAPGSVILGPGTVWLAFQVSGGAGTYSLKASALHTCDYQYYNDPGPPPAGGTESFPAAVGALAQNEGNGFGEPAVDLNACAVAPSPYGTPGCSVAGFYDTDGSGIFSDDDIYFMPLYVASRQTVDAISLQVAVSDGSTLQCALYSNDGSSQPGTLLALSGAVPAPGAGAYTLALAAPGGLTLAPGTVWLAFQATGGSGSYTLSASAEQTCDYRIYADPSPPPAGLAELFPTTAGSSAQDEGDGFGALAVDLNACPVTPSPTVSPSMSPTPTQTLSATNTPGSPTSTTTVTPLLCDPSETNCGGICSLTSSDPQNCGSCGVVCPQGYTCSGGGCVLSCQSGETACSGACVNLSNSLQNCGACGTTCPPGYVCSGGGCVLSCETGETNCSNTCVLLKTNNQNCGACGVVCPAGQVCVNGACGCPASEPNACGSGAAAFCTNIQSDPQNCGACGRVCAPGQVCNGGGCVVSCVSGETGCPSSSPVGCYNLTDDSQNCGACGMVCPAGQSCNGSSCACPADEPNACGSGVNAICTSFQTDLHNCGACGAICPAGQICNGGHCVPSCGAPLSVCGGVCVNIANDPSNCGGCGVQCAAGYACSGSGCVKLAPTPTP